VLGIALGAVYIGVIAVVERQAVANIGAEARALAEQYSTGGVARLIESIDSRVSSSEIIGTSVYMLRAPDGRALAGNLKAWPAEASAPGPVEFPIRQTETIGVRHVAAYAFALPDGFSLLVGRDSASLYAVRARFVSVVFWVTIGTVAVCLITGIALGRQMLARVDKAARVGSAVAEGRLDTRVPVAGRGDEFDRLAEAVNAMLDRIEALMAGMRVATDSIGHDVRRPLTRVRAELELALLREGDARDAETAMASAVEQIDGAVRTLGNLLHIARAEAGVTGGDWGKVDLATIAEDAVELYQPLAEERGITLTLEAERAVCRAEPQLLSQATANLIENALSHGATEGGHVVVRVGADDQRTGHIVLAVVDDGPGIPEADRDKVVERFVRLDAARGGDNFGLGLSLVRAIAQLHYGALDLRDAGPGLDARISIPRWKGAP
ncbi:MAG: HAMP domain-containing sensor histidine kinase, partial [Pseudomonadota bacterium]